MYDVSLGPLILSVDIERWPLASPFSITGYTFEEIEVVVARLAKDGCVGFGEASGVYYKGDKAIDIKSHIERHRKEIEAGVGRVSLQRLFPPGGARNALDSAMWDLDAKLSGAAAWQLAGLETPRPLVTTFTCGADTPERMASVASSYAGARAIKLKLTGDPVDADRVRAVRDALPNVWLAVDANQGFTRVFLEQLMSVLVDMQVSLIEQPFPVGDEALLDAFDSPISIAADESLQTLSDIPRLSGRFDTINIKLDKCGGLSEALAMARSARELGLHAMVGNMIGTSLAMAPAFLVGQLCQVVDLDGPALLARDRAISVRYHDGLITCPAALWG